jgi:hypothetical protein
LGQPNQKIIDNNNFTANAKKGIYLDRIYNSNITNNDFTGDIDTAIHIIASKQINIGLNVLDRRNYHPAPIGTGILIRNTDVQVANNNIYGFNYGSEYYCRRPLYNSIFIHNLYDSNRIGVLIADSLNPELYTNPGLLMPRIGVQLFCNKFYYNGIGIFGSGNLIIQGSVQNDAANDFIGNYDWNMLWQNSSANIDYYFKSTYRLRTNPKLCNLCAPHIINGALRYTSNVDSMPMNSQFTCFNTWIIMEPMKINNSKELKNISVNPNPFNEQLVIKCKTDLFLNTTITVYDIFGKEIYRNQMIKEELEVETDNWKAGIYLIKVIQDSNILGQFKFLKI